ncbi:hypothetical protein [Rhizobium mongolense]|uniref:hypothetical protein n=1 Tax=Rhizobium mongolense TaxID=57676 RepID=UPI0034A5BB78
MSVQQTGASRKMPIAWIVGTIFGIVALLVVGFVWWKSGRLAPDLFPEFKMFPSARAFDPPGTVFRIAPDGIRYDVMDLSGELKTSGGDETLPEQSGNRKITGEAIADFLAGNASASGSGSLNVSLKLRGGHREKTSDTEIDKVLAKALQGINLRKDSKYYLIRETISATEIEYVLTSTDAQAAGLQVGQSSSPKGSTKIENSENGETRLVAKFNAPLRVFYKPEQVTFQSSGLTGELKVSLDKVSEPLLWKSERSE